MEQYASNAELREPSRDGNSLLRMCSQPWASAELASHYALLVSCSPGSVKVRPEVLSRCSPQAQSTGECINRTVVLVLGAWEGWTCQVDIAQYIGEICRYVLSTPEKPEDRQHKVRLIFGNGLRPQIWEKFVERFQVPKIGEFYGSTEGISNLAGGEPMFYHMSDKTEQFKASNLVVPHCSVGPCTGCATHPLYSLDSSTVHDEFPTVLSTHKNSSFYWIAWRPLSLMFSRTNRKLSFLPLDKARQQWRVFNTVVPRSEASRRVATQPGSLSFSCHPLPPTMTHFARTIPFPPTTTPVAGTITLPPTATHVSGTITLPPTATHVSGTITLPPTATRYWDNHPTSHRDSCFWDILLFHLNTDSTVGAVGFVPRYASFAYPVVLVKVDEATEEPIRDVNGYCIKCQPGLYKGWVKFVHTLTCGTHFIGGQETQKYVFYFTLFLSYNHAGWAAACGSPDEIGMFLGKINPNKAIRSFTGYADKSASDKKILHDVFKKGDQYFNSGDVLVMDELGYFFFKDRTGDTFRWRGENVATSEVEAVISNIFGLKDAVVYGVEVNVFWPSYLSSALAPAAPTTLPTAWTGPQSMFYYPLPPIETHVAGTVPLPPTVTHVAGTVPLPPTATHVARTVPLPPTATHVAGTVSLPPTATHVAGTVPLPPTATPCCRDSVLSPSNLIVPSGGMEYTRGPLFYDPDCNHQTPERQHSAPASPRVPAPELANSFPRLPLTPTIRPPPTPISPFSPEGYHLHTLATPEPTYVFSTISLPYPHPLDP
uniref:AMP-dependent synthetase/ligase domain-containing protein n=1 Tax=Timema monikensis TaxID=170555 RepID=A0A7R9EH34_9NEOP|nr:unnamed protein product [Timema monikensis]